MCILATSLSESEPRFWEASLCHALECGTRANALGCQGRWLNSTSPSIAPLPLLGSISESNQEVVTFVLFGPTNAYGRTTVTHDRKSANDVKKSA